MSLHRAAQAMNLAQLLRQTTQLHPHRAGLIQGERRWTWSELDARVDALVLALRGLGVRQGERVLVHSRNNLAMFESAWACFRLGAVWVPTNCRLAPPEVAYLASSSGAVAMLCEGLFAEHASAARAASPALVHHIRVGDSVGEGMGEGMGDTVGKRGSAVKPSTDGHGYEALIAQHLGQRAETATVAPDDALWFFYTSGTTGRPKAGILTHGQMAFVVANHLADLIPGTTERDVSIAVAPLSHGAGIHMLLNVARGAATVLLQGERLDPEEAWRLVQRHRVSNLFTVPTIVKLLVEHPAVDQVDHSSLRYVIYAGAPMYRADQQLALNKLGPVLVQYFGLGEVTGCITVLPPHMHSADDDDPNAHIGSCGRPRTGMEVAILDAELRPLPVGEVGEICCRGPAVFAGYHNNPEATAKALRGGWFHTGDLGRLDARGLLFITGRESDMYISGGSNVYPREVEEVLLTHPGVAEVAIVGLPDKQWGEVGVAVVVRRAGPPAGALPVSAAELLAHLDGRCAKYRWPRHIAFWSALPRSGYGKVPKRDIRERLLASGELVLNLP